MIAVPDAALLPSQPRPVRRANSSSSTRGNPWGYVRNGRDRSTPQSSQCPVVESLPYERGSATPYAALGRTVTLRPAIGRHNPHPSPSPFPTPSPPPPRPPSPTLV